MIRALVVLLVLATAAPALAQPQTVPAHNHTMTVGPQSGAVSLLAARIRSMLGVTNDSANTVYCTTDSTNAADGVGIRLNATGGSVLFDVKVPFGALRCFATSSSRIQVIEGR